MKLTEDKRMKLERNLKDAGILHELDFIQDFVQGDLWAFFSQTRGHFYFSKEKFIFIGGLLGTDNFDVPYNKITEVKLCNVGGLIPFLPTGLKITYTDENGKVVKKKCSVMKRKEWMAYLIERGAQAGN